MAKNGWRNWHRCGILQNSLSVHQTKRYWNCTLRIFGKMDTNYCGFHRVWETDRWLRSQLNEEELQKYTSIFLKANGSKFGLHRVAGGRVEVCNLQDLYHRKQKIGHRGSLQRRKVGPNTRASNGLISQEGQDILWERWHDGWRNGHFGPNIRLKCGEIGLSWRSWNRRYKMC